MKFQSIFLVAALLLAGCTTTNVKEYQAPDGTSIKTVKCTSDPSKCFEQASQSCSSEGSYRVISSESHAGGLIADIFPGPVTWYSMTYACGPSDGKMPDFKFTGERYTPPPPSAAPVIIKQSPSTTNCTTFGNTVNCNSY
ncbi:MAG: hypothetical protein U1C96_04460 [Gallionella sp.]|nr:hypothetical protein [Gallionella sp.]